MKSEAQKRRRIARRKDPRLRKMKARQRAKNMRKRLKEQEISETFMSTLRAAFSNVKETFREKMNNARMSIFDAERKVKE